MQFKEYYLKFANCKIEFKKTKQLEGPPILASEGRESRSHLGLETKGTETLGLVLNFGTCLVSDENFWDSLVPVSSRWYNFYLVSSRSRPDLDE